MVSMSLSGSGSGGPRLSDGDRERVVEVLKTSCSDGRLTLDEFSERVGGAYQAASLEDLVPVLADLPHPFGSDLAGVVGRLPEEAAAAVPEVAVGRRATRWTVSIMGGSQRRGRWRLRDKTTAVAVMGGCQLDLRNAQVEGPAVDITAVAVMGGIDIIVPEGIDVELGGIAIMGGKDSRIKHTPLLPGSPIIRVKAFAFWGAVSVRSKPTHSQRSGEGLPGPVEPSIGRSANTSQMPQAPRLIDAIVEGRTDAGGDLRAAGNWPEGTVTIMFSDIEGFTSITERLGDRRAVAVLHEHNDIIRQGIARSGGHEIKSQGDGFMVAFSGASHALECAVGIQSAFADRNRSQPDLPLKIRLGLHSGEAIRDGNDFLGGAVILAARITQEAKGGEILVSSVLKELCDLSGEFQFGNGRDVNLKGLSASRRLYSVTATGFHDP